MAATNLIKSSEQHIGEGSICFSHRGNDRHLLTIISALGSPGASTVAVAGTAAAAMMPLLPMRSMTRAVVCFSRGSTSSGTAILRARRHLSWLSALPPLVMTAAVVFGSASMPAVAAGISKLSAFSSLAATGIVFSWASPPTVAPPDISRLSASSSLAVMTAVVFGWAYMPIIAADIALLSVASLLVMVAAVSSWASLPAVGACLPR